MGKYRQEVADKKEAKEKGISLKEVIEAREKANVSVKTAKSKFKKTKKQDFAFEIVLKDEAG